VTSLLKVSVSLLLVGSAMSTLAQKNDVRGIDLAVTYTAQRTQQANTSNGVWLQGGSMQLGADFYRGFGAVADVTGLHTASIGASGVPFSEVTATFGPRYRWRSGRVSVYGQALAGEGSAFDSVLPGKGAAQTSSNALALKVGGGLDYGLSPHLALRVLDAAWAHTRYANSTNGIQNDVRLGAGVVFKFR
jgi:outer membrane immunogenic protein